LPCFKERETATGGETWCATNVRQAIMEAILRIVTTMRQQETRPLSRRRSDGNTIWRFSSRHYRGWVLLLNIGLVLLATRLVYGDMPRQRAADDQLRDQKQELNGLVEERTQELAALSTHLQGVSEQEKSALSRELHDDSAVFWSRHAWICLGLQQRLPTSDPGVEQRFRRIHESLSAGSRSEAPVLSRSCARPCSTTWALFAALRWQFKETCRRSGLRCSESMPETSFGSIPTRRSAFSGSLRRL